MRPSRPAHVFATALVTLAAVVALGAPALAESPSPTPPGGPGSTMRSTPVEPRAGRAAKERLDARRAQVPAEVSAWWVDPATHQTVVAVVGPASGAARAFAADGDPSAVRLQPMSTPVRPLVAGRFGAGRPVGEWRRPGVGRQDRAVAATQAGPGSKSERRRPGVGRQDRAVAATVARDAPTPTPLVGGSAITTSGTRCSDGFSARRGTTTYLLTAGHCTAEGRSWSGAGKTPIGTAVRTEYPGHDYGIVQVTGTTTWRGSGRVQGGPTITGATEAPVGSTVCRSGSTSGYHCGLVQATDATVNYGNGTVISGLTQTSVCAEPGDSGGPFVTPDTAQAQGTLSGGTGDCTAGGTTYFQPIAPVLAAMDLTLVTGD